MFQIWQMKQRKDVHLNFVLESAAESKVMHSQIANLNDVPTVELNMLLILVSYQLKYVISTVDLV